MFNFKKISIIVAIPLLISLLYSNCSEVAFDDSASLGKVGFGPETAPGVPPEEEGPDEEIICGGILTDENCEEDIESGKGLMGGLYYYPDVYSNNAISHNVDSLIENEFDFAAPIYFNQVFVPTLQFSQGFPYAGGVFKKPNGETLVEGFAIELFTKLKLRADQDPGEYEFAVLSDDGAKLLNLDSGVTLVNSDGAHSTKMACGSSMLLQANQEVHLRLRYYQGPRTEIALTLLMRKKDPSNSDVHCGSASTYQFFYASSSDKTNGVTPNYQDFWFGDLIDADWEVPTADNFVLPQ